MNTVDENMYNSSLYVGDLHKDVSERTLVSLFGEAVVSSCKVVREMETKRSLCYAYVNFYSHEEAKRAMMEFNQTPCQGKPLRIMWSVRSPESRRDQKSNLFIKNLDTSVDAKTIYEAFSTFGPILSFKIATDDLGHSLGYGFIHYATESAADDVIKKVDGVEFKGKRVSVCRFLPRSERPQSGGTKYNNLFFKCFSGTPEGEVVERFNKYGRVTSSLFPKSEDGQSKNFGFVCFENFDSAMKAADELNGINLGDEKPFYVTRALKKYERAAQLENFRDERRRTLQQTFKDKNLYVRNFSEHLTDMDLRKLFVEFGNIVSCRVMVDKDKKSRMFGFVCFDSVDSAIKARDVMNGKNIDGKSLFVTIAQTKEERRYQMSLQYSNMRMNNQGAVRPEGQIGGYARQAIVQNIPQMSSIPINPQDRQNPAQRQFMTIAAMQNPAVPAQMPRGNPISQYPVNQTFSQFSQKPSRGKGNQGAQKGYYQKHGNAAYGGRSRKENIEVDANAEAGETNERDKQISNVALNEFLRNLVSEFVPKEGVEIFLELVFSQNEYNKHMTNKESIVAYLKNLYDHARENIA